MSDLKPALMIRRGRTVHRRMVPFVSEFAYRLFLIDIDIDRVDEASRQTASFSARKAALFSFRASDHGALGEDTLRNWANSEFREAGVDSRDLRIRLVTFPRHLFYKFAPISLWLAEDEAGDPKGILYEVRNTFGERHVYAASIEAGRNLHEADKVFHVSPFFDVAGTYRFSLRYAADELFLTVSTLDQSKPSHMATLETKSAPATGLAFAATALSMPFSTLGVSLGIHWEALKLWLKGANYHPKPHKERSTRSVAAPLSSKTQEHKA